MTPALLTSTWIAPWRLDDGLDRLLGRGGVAQVGDHDRHVDAFRAEPALGSFQLGTVPRQQHDLGALLAELAGDQQPQSSGPAGHERDAALEVDTLPRAAGLGRKRGAHDDSAGDEKRVFSSHAPA